MVKTELVIIQPTPFCNISCRYCYLSHRSLTTRLTMQTLAQICLVLFTSPFVGDEITIVWHAGEPLVMPVSFYERAFECIASYNTRGIQITHAIQTNATLITQEWCDLFSRYHVQLGVSLDGPQHVHDAHRVDRSDRGTFDRAMRGVGLLQQNKLPFSVIAVVTEYSLAYPEEIWNFFMQLRPARLGLSIEEIEGMNVRSSFVHEGDIQRYEQFFSSILALQEQVSTPLVIREIEQLLRCVREGTLLIRSQTNVAGKIFSFDCEGNISTFSPELLTQSHPRYGDFIFGNVFRDTLEAALQGSKFLTVQAQIQRGVRRCLESCDYFLFCGGGYPSNKLSECGAFDVTETLACRLKVKAAAEAMLKHLEKRYQVAAASTLFM